MRGATTAETRGLRCVVFGAIFDTCRAKLVYRIPRISTHPQTH